MGKVDTVQKETDMQIFYLIRFVEKKNFVNENLYVIFEGQFLFDCRIPCWGRKIC